MFIKKLKPKSRAQAMVEFALVLPILLLVVYGLLEAGRLLFIFASVNTASRQAARYGSAIGLTDAGVPHYEDCTGITAAANNVAFIAPFTNVNITYDAGLDSSGNVVPIKYGGTPGTTLDVDPANGNRCPSVPAGTVADGDRISVYVSAQFSPIVPLVPLGPMTIASTASRTIVGEISIHVTAQPGEWIPSSGGSGLSVSLEITPSPSTYSYVGDTITYTYTITNNGSLDVPGPFSVTDNTFSTNANCSGAAASLAPDESTTCTYTYTISQADIDNGSLTNVARALGTGVTSNQAQATVTFVPDPKLALLSITPDPSEAFDTNTRINFYYNIENTGNVPLDSFSVVDTDIVTLGFSCPAGQLLPGDTKTCSGYYYPTVSDLSNGSIDYVASVRAGDGTLSNPAGAFVLTSRLFLFEITPDVNSINTPGQVIQFTYYLRNRGSVDINSIDSITGPYVQNVDCSGANLPLSPGGETTCTSTYTVQQPDLDAGGTLTLDAVVNASTAGGGTLVSNHRKASLTVFQNPVLSLTISTDTTNNLILVDGTVHYTFSLKNIGNVSLYGFTVTNNDLSDGTSQTLSCSDPTTLLAPQQTRECKPVISEKIFRVIDAAARLNGPYINEAVAQAYYGSNLGPISSTLERYILFTYDGPRILLTLTAPETVPTGGGASFTFLVRNTGNVYLYPFILTRIDTNGPNLNPYECSTPTALDVGATWSCTTTPITVTSEITAIWEASASADPAVPPPPTSVVTSQDSATVKPVAATGCSPRHSALTLFASGQRNYFFFTIFNNSPTETITIKQILVNWNNTGGNEIKDLKLENNSIWNLSNNVTASPATFTSFAPGSSLTISPNGGSKLLTVVFKNPYQPYPNLDDNYVLVYFSEPSCATTVLDTRDDSQLQGN